jgi:hypothetical protein
MKKILFLILISFFFNISESKANKTCIKKKDDGKWPFYYKNYYNGWNTCPLGFKEVSSYEFWAFKEKMDKKYAVSHDPNKVYKTPSESIAKTASNESSNWRKGLQVETTKPDKKQNLTTSNSLKNFNNNHKYIFNAFVFPEIGTLRNIMGTTTWNEKEVILLLKNGECKFGTDLKKLIKNFDYKGNFDFKCRYHIKNDVIYANIQEKSNVTIYTDKNKVSGQFSRDRNLYNIVKSHEVLRLSQELKMSKLSNLINTKSANLPENNNTLSFSNGDKFIGETKKKIRNGFVTETMWLDEKKTQKINLETYFENNCPVYGSISYVRPETELFSRSIFGLYSDCKLLGQNSKLATIYFDEKGEVVGISLDKQDVTHIYGRKKYIGIEMVNAQNDIGVIVKELLEDYPAEKSSLKINDLIVRVNNIRVKNMKNFTQLIQEIQSDQKLKIDFVSSNKINDKIDYNEKDIKTTYIIPKIETNKTKLRLFYNPKEEEYSEIISTFFPTGTKDAYLPDYIELKKNSSEWQARQELLKKDFNILYKYYLSIKESKTKKLPEMDFSQFYIVSNKTNIFKEESKKKVEVAKAKEPKQEEFKPENKDVDNQAPIIEVAKNLKFESQTFKFKGRIKDKNKFYLTANGRPVKTDRKGRFEIEGFVIDPEQGEQLQLVAIDQWNNRSEQTVNIEVEFKQVVDARSYEKPNPNKVRVRNNDNKVGIIIGIEKYQTLNNVDAPYANRDANAFRAYANRALGIPNQNLKVLIDNKATRAELLKSLKIWLPQVTRGQQKDVYIFFAGHGLASDDGKDLHILPQDGDPILLEDTAISRVEMFELINKVNPNSVTMFFDTCYSGQTRSEQMLVAGLRPVRIVANDQEIPNNYTIFTASDNDETSGSIEQAEHGIFSYYLMKGLEGNADLNKDKTLTNGELIAYLKNNVSQEAFSQNRQQEPMLSGNPDNILIRY